MRRACWSAALLLAVAAPGVAAPFELTNDRLYVQAVVSGRSVWALLDSGAEMSVLDDDLARDAGLEATGGAEMKGSGGSAQARFAKADLAAAGRDLGARDVAVVDLADVERRLAGRPLAMILGRDFFDAGPVEIDFARREVVPRPPGTTRPGRAIPLGEHKGVMTMPAAIEGRDPVAAAFDLGNGSGVLVGRAYAQRAGLLAPGRFVSRALGGGIGGGVARDRVVLRTLTLAGRTFRDVPADIDPTPDAPDLNIGTGILKTYSLLVDFPNRRLWLDPMR